MSTEEQESKAMHFFERIANDMSELLSLAKRGQEPAADPTEPPNNRRRARKIDDPAADPGARGNNPPADPPPAPPPPPADPPPKEPTFLGRFLGK